MKIQILLPVAIFIWLLPIHNDAKGDLVTTTAGRVIQGTVIQTNSEEVLVLADYGTTSLPANVVQKIVLETEKRPTTLSTNTVTTAGRLPKWNFIVAKLANQVWADKLRQIPATVITNGILKNVPYISFRCGIDYEVNIYGDLDNPAGVEVGLYRSLLSKNYAKENAIAFVAAILNSETDRATVTKLDREKDLVRKGGFTFEITPATADDSYGGWWVSIYDDKALDQARASDKELAAISVLNSAIIKVNPENNNGAWTKDDLKYARPSTTTVPVSQTSASYLNSYTTPPASPYSDVAPEHDHGSVYVHGYYRSNGTYVHSYTRR